MRNGQQEVPQIPEMDSGEKRLNELGYKQELRREMVIILSLNIPLLCFMFFYSFLFGFVQFLFLLILCRLCLKHLQYRFRR